MLYECPDCNQQVRLTQERPVQDGAKAQCGPCGAIYRIRLTPVLKPPPRSETTEAEVKA